MNCKNKSFLIKRKAFTLIELLIVIAIIGILFIVLVSKVDFATDKAKATGVQTDFRSFQLAFEQVAKENSGFNTFGWDTGDANGNRIRDSYDKGDANKNGKQDSGEIFVGSKTYGETWNNIYTLTNPADANDKSAIAALEEAINKNLDPKLHITIHDDLTITMANGAQDPWNTEYHGYYITNATVDNKDRGAIVMYSNGANQEWGSEHGIANGDVVINVPGNNVYGKDDYALATVYTYANGYGEVKSITYGFSNNQSLLSGGSNMELPNTNDDIMECGHGRKEAGDHTQKECGHFACEECGCTPASCGVESHWSNDGKEHTTTVNHADHTYACQCTGWVVPEGGTYYTSVKTQTVGDYTGATAVYTAGEKLPCGYIPKQFDIFVYGDYEYAYGLNMNYQSKWNTNGSQNGWGVAINTTKTDKNQTSYGPILESINDKPITNMDRTFENATSLLNAPQIPTTVTSIEHTFYGCTSLVTAPVIPNGVNSLYYTFYNCSSLVNPPDLSQATNITDMRYSFCGCSALIATPIIPNGVSNLSYAFSNCKSLKTVSPIPESVSGLGWTFVNCTSIEGVIEINCNYLSDASFHYCLDYVDFSKQNITLTGTCSRLDSIGAKGRNYCAECNGTCQGNH